MKFGRRQEPSNDSSYEICSNNSVHCCKCYDISEIFSTDTKPNTSLSKHFLDCVKSQFPTEQQSASSSGCESASELTGSSPSTKKRIKWTTDLHDKFIECVNHLGGSMKATPKGILKLMSTPELTIYHVKSHLQKYRSLKHVHSTQETRLEEEEIHTKGSRIKELMRLQDEVRQHLQDQLKMQRELYLLVEEQNQQLQEMIKNQKGKIL